jgi:hypothetical protein
VGELDSSGDGRMWFDVVGRATAAVRVESGRCLGDTGCLLRRQLNCEVEFSVNFYDRAGIWIVEFVTGEKEDEV